MSTTEKFSNEDLSKLIQDVLKAHGDKSFRVGSISQRKNTFGKGEWFQVTLLTHADTPMHRFMEAFANIEEEIQEKHGIDILLLPEVIPD